MKFIASRIPFGRLVASDEAGHPVGSPLHKASGKKRLECLSQAQQVLACVPEPGEQVHALMTGFYDLMHLLIVLLDKVGHAGHLRIATLSYNGRNLAEMTRLLDEKRIGQLSLVTSCFFRDHNKDLWEKTLEEFGTRNARARPHARTPRLSPSTPRPATSSWRARPTSGPTATASNFAS